MKKIGFALALALIASAAAATSAAAMETSYMSHIHPDGKLHCFGCGTSCISWAQ